MNATSTALNSLAPLVGTWAIDGPGLSGTVRYEWMDGGGFLVQHVELVHDGEATRGVEYIGLHAESGELRSHFFAQSGEILEYVYQLSGDTLTIWYGGVGSPAKFVGTFDADRVRNTGAWHWPGGGYESNMTRVEEPAR
ncbi:hypothetical protein HNP84_003602 [Thermocatellispora tengchongensis]|uniref:DUF1579 domain-containing protein n=1 Tax=Thermocatellispora tengchongensis TaxID=1073253 RepID=A0A840P5P0_9ACTN|nr:hypothetical protein [Thermocatellispora tengchongensis]MBB5133876.1 hypothetical protein [Thermocatellispora tengchongensis]